MSFPIENCESIRETDKAVLVESEFFEDYDDDGHMWIPKSQIHDDSEIWKVSQKGDVVVSSWFAEQKGWL